MKTSTLIAVVVMTLGVGCNLRVKDRPHLLGVNTSTTDQRFSTRGIGSSAPITTEAQREAQQQALLRLEQERLEIALRRERNAEHQLDVAMQQLNDSRLMVRGGDATKTKEPSVEQCPAVKTPGTERL